MESSQESEGGQRERADRARIGSASPGASRGGDSAPPGLPEPPGPSVSDREGLGTVALALGTLSSGVLRAAALLVFVYLLHVLSTLLIPLVTALLLSFLLRPSVRRLARATRMPDGACAGGVLLVFLTLVVYAAYALAGPAAAWVERAPESLEEIRGKIAVLEQHVAVLGRAQSELEQLTRAAGDPDPPEEVVVQGPSLGGMMLSELREFGVGLGAMLILLYFLLSSGDVFVRKTIELVPRLRQRKRVVETFREVEADISTYLGTITVINAGLALVVAGALSLLGFPNPFFWGAVAGVLNFVPYLGAIATFGLLCVVSVLSFEHVTQAALPPLVFAMMNGLEGFIVTPQILGRRLLLNPVVVLLNLFFWTWAWGTVGALLSTPILVAFKATAAHLESLRPIGEYISA